MKSRTYTMPEGRNIRDMANAVYSMLITDEKMDAQVLTASGGEYIVQGRAQNGKLTQWVGMDRSISVRFAQMANGSVQVDIGKGEWLKKSLTMATSMVVLWPLAVTSGVGMVQQGKLPGKIERTIQMYLAGITPAYQIA